MRITGVTSRILSYPLAEADLLDRYGDRPREDQPAYHISLDTLHTDEGLEGHTMQYVGRSADAGRVLAQGLHAWYAGDVIGRDPSDIESIWQDLRRKNRHLYGVSDAITGSLDVALWDLRGKAAGLPIATMLGLARTRVPTYATARAIGPTPQVVFEEARRRQAEGFRGFKVQFDAGLARDEPRFRAAREAVGPSFPLMEDGSGLYSFVEAVRVGEVLEELGYRWFEEPIPDRNLDQLRRLSQRLRIPIAALETVRLHEMPEAIRHGAVDVLRGDVLIKGGITGLRKACVTAELFGYGLEIHGIGPVLLELANLHVALSVEVSEFVEAHDPFYEHGVVGRPLAIDAEGCRIMPRAPGLGAEIDWDWVDDHTCDTLRSGQAPTTR
jgi:L-alanine-DL-glutamate epimerase-like enolase superfamily enzyme